MKLLTKNFGEIEYEEKDIIYFKDGLPGFLQDKKFVLIIEDPESPFTWLQSVDHKDLAFVLTQPTLFYKDYEPSVKDELMEQLGDIKDGDLQVYAVVVVPEDITKMSVNLRAPIIIHTKNKKAMQVIVDNEEYKVKHYIYEELISKKDNEKVGE